MKEFLSRIWTAPAKTFAGMVAAGVVALLASWAEAPLWVTVAGSTVVAMLGAFSGNPKSKLP